MIGIFVEEEHLVWYFVLQRLTVYGANRLYESLMFVIVLETMQKNIVLDLIVPGCSFLHHVCPME